MKSVLRIAFVLLATAWLLRCGGGVRYDDLGGAPFAPDDAKPELSLLTPAAGTHRGGTEVTIEGASFSANVSVEIGGAACPVNSVSGDRIRCTTPAKTPGAADVVVKNPASETTTLTGAYTYREYLYIVNVGSDSVSGFAMDPSSGALSEAPGSPFALGFNVIADGDITADPKGRFLYVSEGGGPKVAGFRVDGASGSLTPLPGSPFSLQEAESFSKVGLAVEPLGRFLYAAHYDYHRLHAFGVPSSGSLQFISELTTNRADRRVLVHPQKSIVYTLAAFNTQGDIIVYNVGANGQVSSELSNHSVPGGDSINTLAVDPLGRFLFYTIENSGGSNGKAGTFTVNSNGALTHLNNMFVEFGPDAIAVTSQFVFVTIDKLSAFKIGSDGTLSQVAGSPVSADQSPDAVAVNATGTYVYVANSTSNNVSLFKIDANGLPSLLPSPNPISVGTTPKMMVVQ